jgi:hypothetical protein
MRIKSAAVIAVMATLLLLPLSNGPALAQKRVALVIGNGAYQNVTKLPNPIKDAWTIAATFRNAGFDSVALRQDLGAMEFKRALREFADAAQDADVAVVYYAGHGIQVRDVNYLIPVDAKLATEVEVRDEAVSLDRVLALLEPVKRLRLVILDACRENPYAGRMKVASASRALTRGLARIEPENNSLVAYAAKGGQIAQDGLGDHGPFTSALIRHIAVPGLDIRLALGRVRDEVLKNTAYKQEPFVYGSLGGDAIALVPAPSGLNQQLLGDAKGDYEMAERIGTKEAWDAFLATHERGLYADLARAQLAKLILAEANLTEATASGRPQKMELASASPTNPAKSRVREAAGSAPTDVAALPAQLPKSDPGVSPPLAASRQLPTDMAELMLALVSELRRLGCLVGQKDRNTGDAIREVVKRYLSEKGRPAEDIKVIDSVIAELKDDNERACAASCVRGEHWEGDRCVANATSETGPDKRAGAKAGARQPNGE